MNMEELATALERELAGDVRADAYTRHLYAADASMFAVEPLAVAFPRDADDVAAAVQRRRRGWACRSSRAAAARASPGRRRAGAGWCSTSRATWTRSARSTPTRGACASSRASCRSGSTTPSSRYGLGFGPDTSTSNRATLGGMIGNNSSGSESIVYGTTIDHVARAGGRARRRLARHVLGGLGARAATSSGGSTAASRRSCATTRGRSPRTTRSTGASRAATGSTASTRSTSPS